MFEKSLVDLIRGMRQQKGNEKEYIETRLRECRKEIKSQDISIKATALLKLTYLEMFGHDMSWASFHVLEVMSSQIFMEKRVGYLAAIQSFRSDTEVMMLAENLLKKDLTSPTQITVALPLTAVPHIINPSMANSLLTDILPRLTHSSPAIRKKTVVALYRVALVFPDALRPAWPRIKERLEDSYEHASVTSAIVNMICELGWRRPQDFLPLAPRLFDMLVNGDNNWMSIKIIKLFASLTHSEPRLVKKLLPALTKTLKTTPAMSLMYECVNGIIEGGLLASIEGTAEGDEVAELCVGKLRNMLMVDGDPNLKYVALLSFEKIVLSHPYLVSVHQDVILECIDDLDISIRMLALNLVVGMVNSDNITDIVDRLLLQLAYKTPSPVETEEENRFDPYAESDDDSNVETPPQDTRDEVPQLPEEYRFKIIQKILDMCSKDTYSNLNDFEWYIKVLMDLVKACPMVQSTRTSTMVDKSKDISYAIGAELLNIAVRVKAMRPEATLAAQRLVLLENRDTLFPSFSNGGQGVLEACGWIVGEYSQYVTNPKAVLDSLIHTTTSLLPNNILTVYIQAAIKTFARIISDQESSWTPQRRTESTLLMARIIYFLEPLTSHHELEVQEIAVEYLELMRLASEAASSQQVAEDGEYADPPLLLTQAIPSLFNGSELNPVAPGAQKKVEVPEDLDLETPINPKLLTILREAEQDALEVEDDPFTKLYNQKKSTDLSISEPLYDSNLSAAERLDAAAKSEGFSYQADNTMVAERRAKRQERHKDDPFYIGAGGGLDEEDTASAKMHNIIRSTNEGETLDLDAIPVLPLGLEGGDGSPTRTRQDEQREEAARHKRKLEARKKIQIAADENIGAEKPGIDQLQSNPHGLLNAPHLKGAAGKKPRSFLGIDTSGLNSLSLEGSSAASSRLDVEQHEEEERALKEVERLRLEMERAAERIQAREEAVVVKRRKKKKDRSIEKADDGVEGDGVEGDGIEKKKKKNKKKEKEGEEAFKTDERLEGEGGQEVEVKKKKKKRRAIDLSGGASEAPPAQET